MSFVIKNLDLVINQLRDLRDNQNEINCTEENCICEKFDIIIDMIELLINQFKK